FASLQASGHRSCVRRSRASGAFGSGVGVQVPKGHDTASQLHTRSEWELIMSSGSQLRSRALALSRRSFLVATLNSHESGRSYVSRSSHLSLAAIIVS